MSQVGVTVNGRPYKITCDDGQEPRIRRLAQYVDARVGEFVKSIGQVGEARLLLLAALVIADELSDANEALQQERSRLRAAEAEAADAAEAAASGVHGLAQRIEALAARLETP
jgi:cell division protein ZapA